MSLVYLKTIVYPSAIPLNYTDISVDHNFICFSINNNITLLYHVNYTVYQSNSLPSKITGVKLVNNTYILIVTTSFIMQLDYQ